MQGEYEFYSANSGLTPPENFTLNDHMRAYFESPPGMASPDEISVGVIKAITQPGPVQDALNSSYVTLDGVVGAPVYNAQGLPTSVTENGITTVYTYNPNGTPATQKVGDGPVRTFTYNLDGSFGGLA